MWKIKVVKLKISGDNIEKENLDLERDTVKERMKQVLPIKAIAGIKFENQAQFNPYKYGNAIAKICSDSGIKIFEHSKVVDVDTEDDDEYYVVTLENGCKVKAKYIVITTKYPIVIYQDFIS